MKWSFDRDSADVDRATLKRLDKDCNIWVNKDHLLRVQNASRDICQYASRLMFEVLIPPEERLRALEVKIAKGGFVKMFGNMRIDIIYRKYRMCSSAESWVLDC